MTCNKRIKYTNVLIQHGRMFSFVTTSLGSCNANTHKKKQQQQKTKKHEGKALHLKR